MNQGKLYQRYADDFVSSHEFHDAIDARSRNEHQKNFRIMRSLLYDRRDLVEAFFRKDYAGEEDLKELLHLFDTTTSSSKTFVTSGEHRSYAEASLHCPLDMDDCMTLANACNEAGVFSESVTENSLLSLLKGTLSSPLHSCNNRLVAYFFNQLFYSNLIDRNWQYVLARQKCIVSSSGKGTLTQRSFSNAVYENSNLEMSAPMKIIEAAVRLVSQKYQSK